MQKIPTIFFRDETRAGHSVTVHIRPECQWVLDGEGVATSKLDGTNVRVVNGQLFKRQKPQHGDYDEASYVLCDSHDPADRWAFEAFDAEPVDDGIYELVGPKIQGNPHQYERHTLVRVVPFSLDLEIPADHLRDRSYDGLREYLSRSHDEGIVFHHADGRMAKIKKRDFGLRWPPAKPARGQAANE